MQKDIQITFYGTRGSIPVSDPNFQEFGGNTSCISIFRKNLNQLAIIDAGTGIRNLGKHIVNGKFSGEINEINLAFTHFHWDHIQGFPFFKPAYDPNKKINIIALGHDKPANHLRDVFSLQMQAEYFPVALEDLSSEINFIKIERDMVYFKKTIISVMKHDHPGGAYSLRAEMDNKVLAICMDIEHGDQINEDIVELVRDADLLIHDGQYTNEELAKHRGWGHSSFDQAIEVAERANCKQLVITHHDPDHDDKFLNKMEAECQKRFRNCFLAREGMEFYI